MRAYRFTGEQEEVFPGLVFHDEEDGSYETAVLQPGDVFTTNVEVDHPRLASAGRATKEMRAATVVVEPTVEEVTGEAEQQPPTAEAEPVTETPSVSPEE